MKSCRAAAWHEAARRPSTPKQLIAPRPCHGNGVAIPALTTRPARGARARAGQRARLRAPAAAPAGGARPRRRRRGRPSAPPPHAHLQSTAHAAVPAPRRPCMSAAASPQARRLVAGEADGSANPGRHASRHTKDLGVAHDLQPWRDARRATAPRPHLAAMPGSRGTTPGCPGTSSSTVGPSVRHGPAGVALLSLVTTSRRQCPGLSVLGSAEQTKPRIACAAHGGPKVNACWLHPRARDTDAHSALLSLGWRAMLRHWPELDKPYRHAAPHGAARSLQQKMERERAVAP